VVHHLERFPLYVVTCECCDETVQAYAPDLTIALWELSPFVNAHIDCGSLSIVQGIPAQRRKQSSQRPAS
jgi:hypothetical protein